MSVTLRNPDGSVAAGDAEMDDVMKACADDERGYITDDATGDVLYDARVEEGE